MPLREIDLGSRISGSYLNDLHLPFLIPLDFLQNTSYLLKYMLSQQNPYVSTRKFSMTKDVYQPFKGILESRPTNLPEIMVSGHCSFLFIDSKRKPEVEMHRKHRFNHSVNRYNDIF